MIQRPYKAYTRRGPRKKEASKDLTALKAQLDQSSGINRSLGLVFVSLLMYVGITLASVTDLMLLLPDTPVQLPLLNIDIPLFAFFAVTPLIVLGLHLNILINLRLHAEKLFRWIEESPVEESQKLTEIHPFLYNVLGFKPKKTRIYHLSNILVQTVVFYSPVLLLAFFQLRFSDYQSLWMTAWHLVAVLLDAYLIFVFITPVLSKKTVNLLKQKVLQTLKAHRLQLVLLLTLGYTASNFIIVALVYFNTWLDVNTLPFFVHKPQISVSEANLMKAPVDPSYVIKLSEETGLPLAEAMEKARIVLGSGINLRNRRLNYAYLYGCILTNADLFNARLQGAHLLGAQLQGANLVLAQLQGANLMLTKLQGAKLIAVQLQGADLSEAQLQGAGLSQARLQGARLSGAQLQGADLSGAELQGADLSYAKLQGADLSYAKLQGADLSYAKLQGADLSHIKLQGTDLRGTKLQGANLSRAQLQGTDLSLAQLQGAVFYGNTIKGVIFPNIHTETLWQLFDSTTLYNFDSLLLRTDRSYFSSNEQYRSFRNRISNAQNGITRLPDTIPAFDINGFIGYRMDLLSERYIPLENLLIETSYEIDFLTAITHNDSLYHCAKTNYPAKWETFISSNEVKRHSFSEAVRAEIEADIKALNVKED